MTTFGPFTFDATAGALTRGGKPVAIGTRGAALLAALIEGDGAPVGKADLMEAAWPGTIVEEGNLNVQIGTLRKAMGPRPDGQDWIVTVPRVGYRLLKASAVAPAPEPLWPSLAVLPFQNMSGDPEQEYFADGVVEDIITALSRFKSFAVIARNSSFIYKGRAVDVREVARDLGVRYVLEGSVRRASNKLRISAQLVDAESGGHLWAENYDGELEDVFEFQDRITAEVVSVVEPQIQSAEIERSRRERPNSAAAYDLYLRALSLWLGTDEDMRRAMDCLLEAIAIEPDNATYLSWLGRIIQTRVYRSFDRSGTHPRQREYYDRALARGQDDATVLAQCGDGMIHARIDYIRGFEYCRRAVELNPNNLTAVHSAGVANIHLGNLDLAIEHFQQAIRLSPQDSNAAVPMTGIAHVAFLKGDYEDAVAWGQKALSRMPFFPSAHWMIAAGHAVLGRDDEARRARAELQRAVPGVTISSIRDSQPDADPGRIEPILDGLRLAGLPES